MIAGNLVSFNTGNGIHFVGNLSAGSVQVEIINNLVGTIFSGSSTVDANGMPQGNVLNGILLEQAASSVSGSTSGPASADVAFNVSSDNGLSGISVQTYASARPCRHSVRRRFRFTAITSAPTPAAARSVLISNGIVVPFGNALDGILLNDVLGVTVGGTAGGQGNIVSGNLGRGIEVRGDDPDAHSPRSAERCRIRSRIT